ncbi:hypothetical protein [Microbispora sp. CA-102843]|uniref:hypothetical protein n=1 Tax=Microbispora sp. CA-102843 TaxID=3239952 RepID=UPI003D9399B2
MNEPHLAASPGVASPSQDDAVVIERSWDEPERFGAVFDAHHAEIHRYASPPWAGCTPRRSRPRATRTR